MIPLLAEAATPNANTVWLVIIALSSVGANIATIFVATRRKQETVVSPQPLIVAMEKEFATKTAFDEQKKHCTDRHAQLFRAIDKSNENQGSEVEQKVEGVRKDVIEVGKKVAALEATTNLQNQSLAAIQSDIKRLLERPR